MSITDTTHNNTTLTYHTTTVCGWMVKYQPGVWQFCPPLMELLRGDLQEVATLVPPDILSCMKTTSIYINKTFRYPDHEQNILGACVHQSAGWLEENGNLTEKESHVEIYDCWSYTEWVSTQPAMLLHELCHALHWRRREELDDLIRTTYEEAMETGKYHRVFHFNRSIRPHYATTNMQEYFAECSEAFWSSRRFRNDFYPFVHKELSSFDPAGYEMVKNAFHCDRVNTPLLSPPDYDPDNYPLPMMVRQAISPLAGYSVFTPLITPLIFSMASTTMGLTNTLTTCTFILQLCRLYV